MSEKNIHVFLIHHWKWNGQETYVEYQHIPYDSYSPWELLNILTSIIQRMIFQEIVSNFLITNANCLYSITIKFNNDNLNSDVKYQIHQTQYSFYVTPFHITMVMEKHVIISRNGDLPNANCSQFGYLGLGAALVVACIYYQYIYKVIFKCRHHKVM